MRATRNHRKTMLIKLNSRDLKVGMFVSELDRPWIDTPFLVQGFLIGAEAEISSLRQHCNYVYVNPHRSAAGVLPSVRAKRSALSKSGVVVDGTSRGEVLDLTGESSGPDRMSDTMRFMRMTGNTEYAESNPDSNTSSLSGKFFRALLGKGRKETPSSEPVRLAFIPPVIALEIHRETKTLEEEVPNALKCFEGAKFAMSRLVADILAGKTLNLDALWAALDSVVESMLRNGDAMMLAAMTTRQEASVYSRGARAAVHLVALGRHLGLAKIHLSQIAMVGALFDIGKTTLPLRLLTKPNRLTDDEFGVIRGHVQTGLEMLRNVAPLHPDILRAIAEHHEREDGSGYPNALKGNQIGLFGRMAAIVDTFLALTDERPFAEVLSPYVALRKLTEWSNSLFHESLTEIYVQAIGVFPVGSLVELSTGEVAVVVRRNHEQRLKPQVVVVASADKKPAQEPRFVDLAEQDLEQDKPVPITISSGLAAGSYGLDERALRLFTRVDT